MRLLMLALFVLFAKLEWTPPALACDLDRLRADMEWCKDTCTRSHLQAQCAAAGRMGEGARYGDANAVSEAFRFCQHADGPRNNMVSCFNSNHPGLLSVACGVYGNCPPPRTPTPPREEQLSFEQRMTAGGDRHALTVTIVLPVKGSIRSIDLEFFRNGQKVFNIQSYEISTQVDSDRSVITLKAWDRSVDDVSGAEYRIAGRVVVLIP